MTTWFTSDTHFWHKKIVEFCKRPVYGHTNPVEFYPDSSERVSLMNEWLIDKWNSKVKPEDEVWHLGDFAFCGTQKFNAIISRLNGRLNWVLGNHDYGLAKKPDIQYRFESIQKYKFLRVNIPYEDEEEQPQQYTQPIILCHFPILSWDGMAYGSWHLHGHCHGSIDKIYNSTGLRMDVGVDAESNNWYPLSVDDIAKRMALRTVVPVDHHNSSEDNPRFKK